MSVYGRLLTAGAIDCSAGFVLFNCAARISGERDEISLLKLLTITPIPTTAANAASKSGFFLLRIRCFSIPDFCYAVTAASVPVAVRVHALFIVVVSPMASFQFSE